MWNSPGMGIWDTPLPQRTLISYSVEYHLYLAAVVDIPLAIDP